MNRQLDVLFVHPGAADVIYQSLSGKFSAIETPTWSLLLAQSCRSKGFGAAILDCDAERLLDIQALKRIKELNPRLVCFTVYGQNPNAGTTKMLGAIELATQLKRYYPEYPICFVGSHTSALPRDVLNYPCVDFVLLNEGVYALRNLLNTDLKTDLQNIKGIGWKDNLSQTLNPPERVVPTELMDVDLPGSAWDLLPYKDKPFDLYRSCNWHANFHEELRTPYASVYSSLGCQYKCSFCWKKGTKVIVANGKNKKIEDIVLGDTLVAFDTEKNDVVETKIVQMANREVDSYYKITLSDGKILELTGEHPLYSNGNWVNTERLKIGDKVLAIAPSDKISLNKKISNPMKRKEVAKKIGDYWKKKWEEGYRNHLCQTGWQKDHNYSKNEEMVKKMSALASERMKVDNPMKKKEVVDKMSATFKAKIASGEFVPFACTEEGRKVISAAAKKRMLTDNPMLKKKNRTKAFKRMLGSKNPCWQGGISVVYNEYPAEFSKSLKRKVRKRDSYTCQECGKQGKGIKLDVHHIDYNKHNNILCNLISLCASCHSKTNYQRDVWESHFKSKMLVYENCPHYVEVTNIEIINEKTKVYNFECYPHNNYFANYVLGHNCMINILNRVNNEDGINAADSANMRFWSPQFMLKEFDKLASYGVKTVRIADEMFFLRQKYFEPLLNGLVERGYGKDLLMWAYARVDTVRTKYLELFNESGVKWLALGIEAADQKIRKEISKGHYEEVDVRDIVKQISESGISTIANYIFGLPDDNYDSMNATLDLALELNTEMANFYAAFALPGSPLFYEARNKGWALPQSFEAWSFHSYDCLPLPTKYLSAAEVLRFRDRAWNVYFNRPDYLKLVENKFGLTAANHIKDMASIKLRRKLLGD